MKHAFLAVLAAGPAHGYELRRSFEEAFEGIWPPMNAGQIYTTLARLARDGLVVGSDVDQEHRPNKRVFELTEAGREELQRWIDQPAAKSHVKDEFFMKLVLAAATGSGDPREMIRRQREAYLGDLRALTSGSAGGSVADLMAEGATLHIEADLKWLDQLEQRVDELQATGSAPWNR